MRHQYYTSRTESREELKKEVRNWKIAFWITAVIATLLAIYGVVQHRAKTEATMKAYSLEHNCTWVPSEYIDRDPVCK